MKKSIVQAVCLLMIAALAMPAFETMAAGDAPSPRKLTAARTKASPTIDGKLDEPCWKAADKATGFSVFRNPKRLHAERTVGRVCFDDDNLYISMECTVQDTAKLKASIAALGGEFKYRKGGAIEVFLDTNRDRKTFQQYLLHANGSSLITLPSGDLLKILNQDYLISAATLTDKGFNIEMSFPLAMLPLHPDTAKVWGFNLNRSHEFEDKEHYKNGYYSSWNSTRGKSFRLPELFGDLVVDADLSRFYWRVALVREPQPGDSEIPFHVKNETGRNFSGMLTLSIVRPGAKVAAKEYQKSVFLKAGDEQSVSFKHFVAGDDAQAKYTVTLTDSAGKVRYLGGTQKLDLTKGDPWSPPAPTRQQKDAGYIVFGRRYSDSFVYTAVPRAQEVVSSLSIAACSDEFEPVTFSLYPLRNIESLTVKVSDLAGPGGAAIPASAVDVRRATWQSEWKNPKSFVAWQHLLRRFDSLNLIKKRTQRVWLTVKVPPKSAVGEYRGTVSLTSGQTVTRLPLKVRVLPFELSAPDEMGYFMYYRGVGKYTGFYTPEFFAKIVKDMRDHGMTTFTNYNWVQTKDKKTGKNKIDVDNYLLDKLGGHYAPYGVSYAQMVETLGSSGLAQEPILDLYSQHYETDLLLELARIYKERKWPEVAVYVSDEIDGHADRMREARRILTRIKKAAPNLKTTTALGMKGSDALGHMYDIWIGCSSPEMIAKARKMGKHPWTYSCRGILEIHPAYNRYFFGYFPWKIGLKGVSLWAYTDHNVFSDRFINRIGYSKDFVFTPEYKQVHGYVYFENDEIIPVANWECVREGIDDYRYMLTLKKIAQAALAGKSPVARQAGEAGMKLLKDISDRTDLRPAMNDSGGSEFVMDPKYMGDMDAERTRVIEAILKIRKARQQ
ncbi:MAG: sugar-binding protein [Phycisphaerae bacterium]|nr:sugar-binding protein [Phycisphaerae bacterium]